MNSYRDLDYAGDPTTLLAEVEDEAAVDGADAPRAGVALYQLTGQPVAAGQGGADQYAVSAEAYRRRGGCLGAGPGFAKDREVPCWGSQPAPQRGPALADGREGPAQCGEPVAGARERPSDAAIPVSEVYQRIHLRAKVTMNKAFKKMPSDD